jgi:regulator of nucleoside diphosphate kinase
MTRVRHRRTRVASPKECLVEVLTLERTLTELDHVRLLNLVRREKRDDRSPAQSPAIEQLLESCAIVASRQVPPNVVTMYSQVLLRDLATGQRSTLTPCYPADAEPAAGFVSALSPVGSSLLGLTVGSVARWATPGGDERAAEIVAILFQPEASGDYAL